MTDKKTIYEALADVMVDVSHVSKKDRNAHQGFMFRGVDAVVGAIGPALRAHGVIVAPTVRTVDYALVRTVNDKPATACRVLVQYTFYGPCGDSIHCSVAGEAWDAGDKSTPKAMSVAFRTALLQALCLPTDSPDPDHETYERADEPPAPDADALRKQIANVCTARGILLDDAAREFKSRTKMDITKAEPKYLEHFLGYLRTSGSVVGKEKADATTK